MVIQYLCFIAVNGDTILVALSACAEDLQDASQSRLRSKITFWLSCWSFTLSSRWMLLKPGNKPNKYLMTKLWKWSMDSAMEPRFPLHIHLSLQLRKFWDWWPFSLKGPIWAFRIVFWGRREGKRCYFSSGRNFTDWMNDYSHMKIQYAL